MDQRELIAALVKEKKIVSEVGWWEERYVYNRYPYWEGSMPYCDECEDHWRKTTPEKILRVDNLPVSKDKNKIGSPHSIFYKLINEKSGLIIEGEKLIVVSQPRILSPYDEYGEKNQTQFGIPVIVRNGFENTIDQLRTAGVSILVSMVRDLNITIDKIPGLSSKI